MNQETNKLIFAFNYAWGLDTVHHSVKNEWNVNNKSLGQCAVTSLIVQEYLGGDIHYGTVLTNGVNHYWNIINNKKYDFTISQFTNNDIINKIGIKQREDILKNIDTYNRYIILKQRVNIFFNKLKDIESSINKCQLCQLDKVYGDNIYFGTNTKILFVGEAPAKNGWRITGKAWINEKNKIIPSGKILEKLLENMNISLFDISFVEIIKCFPSDRKKLKYYSENCLSFFNKQLELLKPDVIITLGEIPTKILLNNIKFSKLSDVVGKEYSYNSRITLIPIYHPSPISPKSFKGNKPIFDNIILKYLKK